MKTWRRTVLLAVCAALLFSGMPRAAGKAEALPELAEEESILQINGELEPKTLEEMQQMLDSKIPLSVLRERGLVRRPGAAAAGGDDPVGRLRAAGKASKRRSALRLHSRPERPKSSDTRPRNRTHCQTDFCFVCRRGAYVRNSRLVKRKRDFDRGRTALWLDAPFRQ